MARVSLSALLSRSKRNMSNGTHPVVRKSAIKMIKLAYKEGINVQISEGYRSNTRQNQLFNQGRTTSGNIVTNARAGQSWHNYGVAVDFFLTTYNGNAATWFVNNKWERVGQIGVSLGFVWGGNWTIAKDGIVDAPHLQMTGGLSLSQLKRGIKPRLRMKGGNVVIPSVPNRPVKNPVKKWTDKNFNWTGQTLRRNDKGKAVEQAQKKLVKAGYYPNKQANNNGIDGHFGADTESAVYRYQSMHGLGHDGIAGKEVYKSLGGKKPSKKKPANKKGYDKVIKNIQDKLNNYKVNNIKADGFNGPDTKKALIKSYQYEVNRQFKAGLTVDGIAGKRTDNAAVNITVKSSYGNLAHLVQAMLYLQGEKITVDGIYGRDSLRVLKSFQKKNGLKADGIIGRATANKLTRL